MQVATPFHDVPAICFHYRTCRPDDPEDFASPSVDENSFCFFASDKKTVLTGELTSSSFISVFFFSLRLPPDVRHTSSHGSKRERFLWAIENDHILTLYYCALLMKIFPSLRGMGAKYEFAFTVTIKQTPVERCQPNEPSQPRHTLNLQQHIIITRFLNYYSIPSVWPVKIIRF